MTGRSCRRVMASARITLLFSWRILPVISSHRIAVLLKPAHILSRDVGGICCAIFRQDGSSKPISPVEIGGALN
jgi:hypothetical protein